MLLRNKFIRVLLVHIVRLNHSKLSLKLVKADNIGIYKIADCSGASLTFRRICKGFACRLFYSPLQWILPGVASAMSCSQTVPRGPFVLPECVRGMKILDTSAFSVDAAAIGLKVPSVAIAEVSRKFKTVLLKVPKIKPIADLSDSDPDNKTHKLFLFCPTVITSLDSFSDNDREFLLNKGVQIQTCQSYDIVLTYENWSYDQVLDAVLPKDLEGVGGFSIIGHIAHLNLRDHLLEYKHLIGQVILDKLSVVKTVVNKTQTIDNTFRNFQMEVLAGEPNFITIAREHHFSYKMDFSKVYWNSRLASEHQRIVALLRSSDVLYDVFAGIGPFAVPAAKRGCIVLANDLNPESYRWLEENLVLNKVQDKVKPFNMDGRKFIRTILKPDLLDRWKSPSLENSSVHVVMNLPALAIEFLDSFRSLLLPVDFGDPPRSSALPIVHCYCFSRCDDPTVDAANRTATALGIASFKELEKSDVRIVRNVAPGKEMVCVSFRLPWSVLTAQQPTDTLGYSNSEEPVEKKAKAS